jgi:hypothetical protein
MPENNKKKLNLNYSEHEAAKKNLIGTNGSEHHGQSNFFDKGNIFFLFWCLKGLSYKIDFENVDEN